MCGAIIDAVQNERSIESVFYVLPGLYYYALETMTYYFPRHQLLFLSGEELFEGTRFM
jgi:hypothetical protein